MTIENSALNHGAALKQSDASTSGASGDGNNPSRATLQRGYSTEPLPERTFGLDPGYGLGDQVGIGRPHGWER